VSYINNSDYDNVEKRRLLTTSQITLNANVAGI